MELRIFANVETFLAHKEAWDDLWRRSRAVLPTARAELIAHWVQHFAHDRKFTALAVAEGQRFLAGLPLVQRRIKRLIPVADLPANPWSANGELLLDESAELNKVLRCLCQGLGQIGCPLLWIDMVPAQASRWQRLLAEANTLGLSVLVHWRYPVGLLHLEDFSAYWNSRPHHLHKKIRKCFRRLEEAFGTPEIRVVQECSPLQWEEALDRAWQIEDASWKGAAGSSVLRTPRMRDFYLRQTQLLAQWGYPRLAFLEAADRPIAFLYGWEAKGVVQGLKIGYDPAFARFSPGHLLWYVWLQNLGQGHCPTRVDFLGPLTEGTRSWAADMYPIGRVLIAINGWGKKILACYRAYRRYRGTATEPDWLPQCTAPSPEPPEAQGFLESVEYAFS